MSGEECEFEVKLLNDKQMLQFESNKIDKIKTPENMNTISQNTSIENQKPESTQEEENKYITLTEEIWDDIIK